MKHTARILITSVLIILADSCRYPENDFISLRSRQARLLGTWEVQRYTVDGAEHLDSLKSILGDCFNELSFADNNSVKVIHQLCIDQGTYSFQDENFMTLYLAYNRYQSSPLNLKPYGNRYAYLEFYVWKIRQLEFNELKICCDFFGEEQCIYARKTGDS